MLHPRMLMLLAPLAVASGTTTPIPAAPRPASGPSDLVTDEPSPVRAAWESTEEETPRAPGGSPVDLEVVRWTVSRRSKLTSVASAWGIPTKTLVRLNPSIAGSKWVPEGQKLVVFDAGQAPESASIGAPNSGRLRGGVPVPEGTAWTLRRRRHRAFGTRHTIEALVQAFDAFGEAFPDAPKVRLGELSKRRGGAVSPHVSHRTGRDVDIGYVLDGPPPPDDRHWRVATEDNFNVEKNWGLIKSLLATGRVQEIYVSFKLQRLLLEHAAKELPEAELARYFRAANDDYSERTIIRYWRGHRDHMHVRFLCEPGNRRCVSRSLTP